MIRDRLIRIKERLERAFGGDGAYRPPDTPSRSAPPTPAADRAAAGVSPQIRVQPGTGDTPGPNHRTDIGRTWLSAQILSGVAPALLDVRAPDARRAGAIPGSRPVAPDTPIRAMTNLPSPDTPIVVYDADGEGASARIAQALRDAGWTGARRLVGGFREWTESGEAFDPWRDED